MATTVASPFTTTVEVAHQSCTAIPWHFCIEPTARRATGYPVREKDRRAQLESVLVWIYPPMSSSHVPERCSGYSPRPDVDNA